MKVKVSNPRTWPILNGSVQADNIEFYSSSMYPSEIFWRQLRFGDFDVSEMSVSSLLMATANGDDRWVGLPIFTTRRFFHTGMMVRKNAGIESPADLRGKQVAVPEYQQTAALWTRGVLENEFGVKPSEMNFWMERNPDHFGNSGGLFFSAGPDPPGNGVSGYFFGKTLDQ